jgi:MFS superfamily sulfate permease-like transporter
MIGYREIHKRDLSADLQAGFVLFLIALPLCVGIALACVAPASSGIIAGVLGGVLGSLLGGCRLSINGPAAGMIVVVLNGIVSLSDGDAVIGFKRFLACVVIVGVLQVLAGAARLGQYALLAPSAVIHGMMAAIGTIILIKQFPVLLGVKPEAGSMPHLLSQFPQIALHLYVPVALIGLSCLALILLWNSLNSKLAKMIPSALLAVLLGLGIAYFSSGIRPQDLVPLPASFSEFFIFPLFDDVSSMRSITVILAVFLVGSLESQLSTLAVDRMDPSRRSSDYDQELIGKGLVNLGCGMVGGLPVITEIVRSSANISNGAKSPAANLFHGLFLAVAVVVAPEVLRSIPLSALAAILMVIGWRLGHPKHFVEAWHGGKDVFVAFLVTWVVTIADDLLVGLSLGLVTYFAAQIWKGVGWKSFYRPDISIFREANRGRVQVRGALVFSTYLFLLEACATFPELREICLDLGQVTHLDPGLKHNLEGLMGQLEAEGKTLQVIWPANASGHAA